MSALGHLVRQASLAALTLLPLPALADVSAAFDAPTGRIIVTGLTAEERSALVSDPDRLRLRIENAASDRGMMVTLDGQPDALVVVPRFPLRSGAQYRLDLSPAGKDVTLPVDLPAANAPMPTVTGFSPSQSVIPANTLRLYIAFSEPMARGQVLKSVRLLQADGGQVDSPFLNLDAELWDPSQTRITLLLDPGRIKQGLGPNNRAGVPLKDGERYRLVVEGAMKSARGAPLGEDVELTFRAGPPEQRAIAPGDWGIITPPAGTLAPLSLSFDRIMDSGAVRRMLSVEDPAGDRIGGRISTDGGGWSIVPDRPWNIGSYTLHIAAELEDISGNTVSTPFDAPAGTIGTADAAVSLAVEIDR